MHVSLAEAQASLPDLVRRAEAGEEIVLAVPGRPHVRLVPEPIDVWRDRRNAMSSAAKIGSSPSASADAGDRDAVPGSLRDLLRALHGSATERFGPDAAHSADYLYDDFGLPA